MPIFSPLNDILSTLKPMEENALRAYITTGTLEPGTEFFVTFPPDPKQLERYYNVRTEEMYVYYGNEWMKEDTKPMIEVSVQNHYIPSPEQVKAHKQASKPKKPPARTEQGIALEQAKRMERELREYEAARNEMNRRMQEGDYVARMTQEYNDLRIQQPWLTAGEAADIIRRKYNP